MAFNWPIFRTRALTAAIFVLVMLTGLLWNQWSLFVLFSIIHFGCWWEYLKLMEKIHNTSFHIYTRLGFMLAGYAGMLLFCGSRYQVLGYSISQNFFLPVSAAGFILLMIGLYKKQNIHLKAFGAAALGALYISLSCGLMISLWQKGIHWCSFTNNITTRLPIVLVASIWINDTMAYLIGSLIGKSQLTSISPKKTWEGTIGGILLATAATGLIFPLVYVGNISWPLPLFFGLIALTAAVAGTFGDLLESKLKRMANVKDSGSLMPGHGGFLDRFDSLLFATPAVWVYVKFFLL